MGLPDLHGYVCLQNGEDISLMCEGLPKLKSTSRVVSFANDINCRIFVTNANLEFEGHRAWFDLETDGHGHVY